MINEVDRRKPDFVEGVAVKLEDGQAWHFPKPRLQFRIAVADGAYGGMARDQPASETARRFGDRYWKLRDDVSNAISGDDEAVIYNAYGAVAFDLLARNYDLTIEEASDLLVIIPGDEDNVSAWNEILKVALGIAPKNDEGGSGSPPS